jgi:hypothetical protein
MLGGKSAFEVDKIFRMGPGFMDRLLKDHKTPGIPGYCFPLAFVPFVRIFHRLKRVKRRERGESKKIGVPDVNFRLVAFLCDLNGK